MVNIFNGLNKSNHYSQIHQRNVFGWYRNKLTTVFSDFSTVYDANLVDNHFGKFENTLSKEQNSSCRIFLSCVQIQTGENVLNENVWKTLKTTDLAVNIYQNGVWGSYTHQHLRTSNGMLKSLNLSIVRVYFLST